VGAEGVELALLDGGDVESDGPGGRDGRGAVGEEVAGGDVEEALRGVQRAERGEAFGVRGPVEGGGGEGGDHGVVGVGVHGAIAAEGEDDGGLDAADAFDEEGGGGGEVSELELGVLVVEQLVVGDAEDLAGGDELDAAHAAEVGGGGGGAAVGGGLSVGEADDVGFDAGFGGEGEGAAEGEAFVVGVGGDAEEFEGGLGGHG